MPLGTHRTRAYSGGRADRPADACVLIDRSRTGTKDKVIVGENRPAFDAPSWAWCELADRWQPAIARALFCPTDVQKPLPSL